MSLLLAARVRTTRTLVTLAFATSMLAACSNATSSPSTVATVPSAAPTTVQSAGPVGSPPLTGLRVAPSAPCEPGGTGSACIAPGRYSLDASLAPRTISLDVPAGWFEWDPGGGSEGLLVNGGADATDGSGWGLLFAPIGEVPMDPCDKGKGAGSSATAEDVVRTMASWPGFNATTPEAISVDGFQGKLIELRFTKNVESCSPSWVWTTPSSTPIDTYPMVSDPSRPAQFRILNVNGTLLGIRTTDYPDASPFETEQGVRPDPKRHIDDQVQLRAMVESIRITP